MNAVRTYVPVITCRLLLPGVMFGFMCMSSFLDLCRMLRWQAHRAGNCSAVYVHKQQILLSVLSRGKATESEV